MQKQGSVFFDQNKNRWRAAITTPEQQRISKRFDTEKDAQKWLVEQINHINKSTLVEPDKITIGNWLINWLNIYIKPTVKRRTYEGYASLANHATSIASIPLQSIRPEQVQKLYVQLSAKLSAHTISKLHKILRASFKKAHELEMVQKNIMPLVNPPRFTSKPIKIFSQDEITTILQSLKIDRYYSKYYAFVLLAISSGARLGELLGLSWSDINFQTCEINIRKSLQAAKSGELFLETPKSKAGFRRLTVPVEAIAELKKIKADILSAKILSFNSNDDLCFVTQHNTPLSPNNMNRAWHGILKNAGILYRNFHVLRHTHATQLLANGIPLVEVARRIGHAKSSHTLDLYGQAIPNFDAQLGENISKIFSLGS